MAQVSWIAAGLALGTVFTICTTQAVAVKSDNTDNTWRQGWRKAAEDSTLLRTKAESVQSAIDHQQGFQRELALAVLEQQNEKRSSLGLPLLALDENLQKAAEIRAIELCQGGYLEHTRPDGTPWHTVLRDDVPTNFLSAGENLASISYGGEVSHLGFSPSYWLGQWENSQSHYEIMTKEAYSRAGVGIYYIRQDGVTHIYGVTLYAEGE